MRNRGDRFMRTPFIQKQFVIKSSQERVWELLGRTVYRCVPLEKMNIINETTADAIFRWKLCFLRLPLDIRVQLVDISPPSFLGSKIRVRKGIFQMAALEAIFALKPIDNSNTEVTCTGIEQKGINVIGQLLRGPQRRFTEDIFNSIRSQLELLC